MDNRTPAKAEPLSAEGAQWAAGPRGTVAADIIFTMLAHLEAMEAMAVSSQNQPPELPLSRAH